MKLHIFTLLAFALATLVFAADHPDFTGTWKVDVSKLEESKGPPPRMTRRVSKEGNVITMTEIQIREGKERAIIRKFTTDGTHVTGTLNGQPISTRGEWQDNKLVSDTTVGDTITIHEVWSLSDDGRTWTNEMVFNGKSSTMVFTRQYLP
jgi:hypothetical protein